MNNPLSTVHFVHSLGLSWNMKIIHTLKEIATPCQSCVLTIGNFDGMHRGHQALLEHLQVIAQRTASSTAVLTFENHPTEVLSPERAVKQICTPAHKMMLLDAIGINLLILLTFTREFSQLTTEQFLQELQSYSGFTTLILGHDARIGKNREGDHDKVRELAHSKGFSVEYLKPVSQQGIVVSSTHIRKLIQQGDFDQVAQFLGRRYSIYGPVVKGQSQGARLGFPTANLDLSQLILPPYGVYAVQVKHKNELLQGVANLGIAPTVRSEGEPRLEVHLIDQQRDLYGENIEVIFLKYLRGEKKFANITELQQQIAKDVVQAKFVSM